MAMEFVPSVHAPVPMATEYAPRVLAEFPIDTDSVSAFSVCLPMAMLRFEVAAEYNPIPMASLPALAPSPMATA